MPQQLILEGRSLDLPAKQILFAGAEVPVMPLHVHQFKSWTIWNCWGPYIPLHINPQVQMQSLVNSRQKKECIKKNALKGKKKSRPKFSWQRIEVAK